MPLTITRVDKVFDSQLDENVSFMTDMDKEERKERKAEKRVSEFLLY